jgi:hypothetical protein
MENIDFAQLVQDIADALGWTVEVEQEPRPYITLKGKGDEKLYLRWDGGRVRISGKYPRLYDRHRMVGYAIPYGEHPPSITCAVSRGAEAIAQDVERRLLPDYRVLLEKVWSIIAQYRMRNEATKRAAGRLIALFPEETDVRAREGQDWSYEILPDSCIYKIAIAGTTDPQGSVDIDIKGATDEIAQAIVKTIGRLEGWYHE